LRSGLSAPPKGRRRPPLQPPPQIDQRKPLTSYGVVYFLSAEVVYFYSALDKLEKIMVRSFQDVLKIHLDRKVNMRLAANMLGVGRVAEACKLRGLYP
jgi:hypothetical protein